MRKMKVIFMLLCLCLLAGCGGQAGKSEAKSGSYKKIAAAEVKAIIDAGGGHILLDVRTQSEFDAGHIEGAVLIPDTEIAARAKAELPDKNATIFIYCRSGRRSKQAAMELLKLGYTNVYDFGGINDWKYAIVK